MHTSIDSMAGILGWRDSAFWMLHFRIISGERRVRLETGYSWTDRTSSVDMSPKLQWQIQSSQTDVWSNFPGVKCVCYSALGWEESSQFSPLWPLNSPSRRHMAKITCMICRCDASCVSACLVHPLFSLRSFLVPPECTMQEPWLAYKQPAPALTLPSTSGKRLI